MDYVTTVKIVCCYSSTRYQYGTYTVTQGLSFLAMTISLTTKSFSLLIFLGFFGISFLYSPKFLNLVVHSEMHVITLQAATVVWKKTGWYGTVY